MTGGVPFDEARSIAHALGAATPVRPIDVPLAQAAGLVLAADVVAPRPMPAFAASAMDGWVVAGSSPWRVGEAILAGDDPCAVPLEAGRARPIATGAPVPAGALAVLRREHGRLDADRMLRPLEPGGPPPGADLRPAGEEADQGEVLLRAGVRLGIGAVALAAAAGCSSLAVRRPRLVVVVTGDEVRTVGEAGGGAVRDALGPALAALVPALGAELVVLEHAGDDVDVLVERLLAASATADAIVTTGGSSHGPADLVRAAIAAAGGRILVPEVAMRPGHPVLVAEGVGAAPGCDGVPLVGLPGNPLAALATAATVLAPLVRGLQGAPPATPAERRRHPIPDGFPASRPGCTMVLPWRSDDDGAPVPTGWTGSGMLRGIAAADGLVAIDETGARFLDLPGR
ncbi:molybdopterin molybdotransferase MoeA [Agromyces seonyuensis]|uniref:Molybdopterin molybdenumtransferase n=1 Tax=Agromyces seonyuensis TaxID=2662446 RepID=A0A6I4NV01_9MICO|nr:molybdopterin-binding protein [Agromyces seonyuensis]MWB98286.1 molybdopterin molybdenumtransferase MoeA [Agromyces seonyuensis]